MAKGHIFFNLNNVKFDFRHTIDVTPLTRSESIFMAFTGIPSLPLTLQRYARAYMLIKNEERSNRTNVIGREAMLAVQEVLRFARPRIKNQQ